jgi:prolyl oligopeptidase
MRLSLLLLLALAAATFGCGRRRSDPVLKKLLDYPDARATRQVDDYHGTKIWDPYRWMEEIDSPETQAWIKGQNELTAKYFERLSSTRGRIKRRLEELWDYERYSLPFTEGGRYFFRKNDGLQAHSVHYVADSLEEEPRLLLDPNALSPDGSVSVGGVEVSRDGRLMAYALSRSGSDWREIRVRDVETGADLDDHLRWVKFSETSWKPDNSGFFYSRMPQVEEGKELTAVNENPAIYFHRVGTPQEQDQRIYERPDQPKWGLGGEVTEDGIYLVIQAWDGASGHDAVFIKDLEQDSPVIEILGAFDAYYHFLGNEGTRFWFLTDKDAPKGRIVEVDLRNSAPKAWKDLVPEGKHVIDYATVVNDRFLVKRLRYAYSHLTLYRLDGTLQGTVELPAVGTVWMSSSKRTDHESFLLLTGYTNPPTLYRLDPEGGALTIFKRPEVDFDPTDFVSRQVAYISKDGVYVTAFVSHRKGIKLKGDNPTLLYGYGGFGNPMTPWFSPAHLTWMEMGGVLAVPNIRGGGEYGKAWHQAGKRENRQTSFDDFIAAAEQLIENRYTSAKRLAIMGGSNGGLLVGACMTQRPELFGACLPDRGVMDMLRYHKFTIGWAWIGELGSSEEAEMFPILRGYSPYHNVEKGTHYPATLITTADHDDRVVPMHSMKFAARLQACHGGAVPILIRIHSKKGHGAGTTTQQRISDAADRLAFLAENLKMRVRVG